VRALIRGDGAGPHTLDSSSRKAYTSASLRRPTQELAKMVSESPVIAGLRGMNEKILILGGGLPIKAGEEVIGGIGVGGAPGGDKDEACALAGIDKIKSRLKWPKDAGCFSKTRKQAAVGRACGVRLSWLDRAIRNESGRGAVELCGIWGCKEHLWRG
jgi:uncharacterized protein GlcG (DUF336 family)